MVWFEENSYEAQAYEQVQSAPHKAALSHELIAGAAAYEAAKAYENHVARNGHPDSHAKAKEIVAGFAGAFIDRVVETKGQQTHERLEVNYSSSDSYTRAEEYSSNY